MSIHNIFLFLFGISVWIILIFLRKTLPASRTIIVDHAALRISVWADTTQPVDSRVLHVVTDV